MKNAPSGHFICTDTVRRNYFKKGGSKMVKSFVFLGLVAVLLCSNASAQDRGVGLGIILGDPTGLNAKLWTGKSTAIDGAVAWSSGGNSALYLHADYLLHNFNLFKVEEGNLLLYYGIGARFKLTNDTRVGVRIPVGINYIFASAPFDIFLEVVPLLELAPNTAFGVNAGFGVRYFLSRLQKLTSPNTYLPVGRQVKGDLSRMGQ